MADRARRQWTRADAITIFTIFTTTTTTTTTNTNTTNTAAAVT
jgi:hypothetical protein